MLGLLAGLAVGATILGGIFKARQTKKESEAREEEARWQAAEIRAESERAAGQVRKETRWRISDLKTQQRQFMGRQKVLVGSSGVMLTSGSPLSLFTETARRAQEDVRRLEQQGAYDVETILTGAKYEAGAQERAAEYYRRSRPWQIGSSLFGTLASGASMLMKAF